MDKSNENMCKLLIWGIGHINNLLESNGFNGNVIGYIETHKSMERHNGLTVYSADRLPDGYDYIIVVSLHVNEIYKTCIDYNIDINKCIFMRPVKNQIGLSNLDTIKNVLGEKNYTNYCAEHGLREKTFFDNDVRVYNEMNVRENFKINKNYLYPIISDKYSEAGNIGCYFWQDLWAAKLIYQSGVKSHFDIGSRIDGFIAHLLVMDVHVTLIDVREFSEEVENLNTIISDATNLEQVDDESIESMSALCSLEHFGLGRYGDPIDPEACFQCFAAIQRKLKRNGHLYISVPIGKERVEFNAHRIFYPKTIIDCFEQMDLIEFSCAVKNRIEPHVELHKYDDEVKGSSRFGLFHFIKNK